MSTHTAMQMHVCIMGVCSQVRATPRQFFALFYQTTAQATDQTLNSESLFCKAEARYLCNSISASAISAQLTRASTAIGAATAAYQVPVVAFAMYYDYSAWGGASGYKINMPAYKNVFVHDAGATLPDMTAYAAYASTSWAGAFEGYAFTTAEVAEFHAAIATVDVIIDETYPNGQTYDSILTSYGYNASTALPRAFQTGHVFALDGTMDSRGPPYGGTDWFESRIAEPDAFLEDLVKVAHSNVTASTQLKFLRHVLSGGHTVVTAADCAGTATAARTPSASACSSLAGATPTLGTSSARFSYLRTEGSCAAPASVRLGTCPSLPPFPPSAPSPLPPPAPAPPASDGVYVAVEEVHVSFTAAGTVSDFGAAEKGRISTALASAAGISSNAVAVTALPASVAITAVLTAPSIAFAAQMYSALSVALANSTAASALLGLTVETVPTLTVVRRYVKVGGGGGGDDNTGLIVGLAVGISAGALLLGGAAFFLTRKAGSTSIKKVAPAAPPSNPTATSSTVDTATS